jgi:hypothetical protein
MARSILDEMPASRFHKQPYAKAGVAHFGYTQARRFNFPLAKVEAGHMTVIDFHLVVSGMMSVLWHTYL